MNQPPGRKGWSVPLSARIQREAFRSRRYPNNGSTRQIATGCDPILPMIQIDRRSSSLVSSQILGRFCRSVQHRQSPRKVKLAKSGPEWGVGTHYLDIDRSTSNCHSAIALLPIRQFHSSNGNASISLSLDQVSIGGAPPISMASATESAKTPLRPVPL